MWARPGSDGSIGSTTAALSSPSPAPTIGLGDAPTPTDVTINWRAVDSSIPIDGSGFVSANLVNQTDEEQQGQLVVVGSGLDGRLVQRPLSSFDIAPHATQEVRVRVDSLPIQSQTSSSFVAVQAEVTRPDGFVLRVTTDPLYFHFQSGYSQALFYGPELVPQKAPRTAQGTAPVVALGAFRTQPAGGPPSIPPRQARTPFRRAAALRNRSDQRPGRSSERIRGSAGAAHREQWRNHGGAERHTRGSRRGREHLRDVARPVRRFRIRRRHLSGSS